jgi:hypothetical protein
MIEHLADPPRFLVPILGSEVENSEIVLAYEHADSRVGAVLSTKRTGTYFRSGDVWSAVIADETGNICRRDDLKGAPLKGGFASLERHPVFLAVHLQTRPPAHTGKLACQWPFLGLRRPSRLKRISPMKVVLIIDVGQIAMAIVLLAEILK